jgi:outer membrane protein assembly factor BamB
MYKKQTVKILFVFCLIFIILSLVGCGGGSSGGGSLNGNIKWKIPINEAITNKNILRSSSEVVGSFQSSPAIADDGTIYVGSHNGNLYAVNPDGTIKWTYLTMGEIWSAPVIGTDGTIYIQAVGREIYAVNPDGTLKWSYKAGDPGNDPKLVNTGSSPAIGSDGTVYVGCCDENLYALKSDGSLKWSHPGGSQTSPVIGTDGTVYYGTGHAIQALNPTDGSLKWTYPVLVDEMELGSLAIGNDGVIYMSTLDYVDGQHNSLYAVYPDGGTLKLKWKFLLASSTASSPSIGADGTIYIGTSNHILYALNPDGTIKWQKDLGAIIEYTTPTIGADGTIYVCTSHEGGTLFALDSNGNILWSNNQTQSIAAPAISPNGIIYVANYYLFAINSSSLGLQADSPWPTFHKNVKRTGY